MLIKSFYDPQHPNYVSLQQLTWLDNFQIQDVESGRCIWVNVCQLLYPDAFFLEPDCMAFRFAPLVCDCLQNLNENQVLVFFYSYVNQIKIEYHSNQNYIVSFFESFPLPPWDYGDVDAHFWALAIRKYTGQDRLIVHNQNAFWYEEILMVITMVNPVTNEEENYISKVTCPALARRDCLVQLQKFYNLSYYYQKISSVS